MAAFHNRADVEHAYRSGHISQAAMDHFKRSAADVGPRQAVSDLNTAMFDAEFNRGPLAGQTGDPFKDDPFFNPWAPGGAFNRGTNSRSNGSDHHKWTDDEQEF